jgi:hypothetical protein
MMFSNVGLRIKRMGAFHWLFLQFSTIDPQFASGFAAWLPSSGHMIPEAGEWHRSGHIPSYGRTQ